MSIHRRNYAKSVLLEQQMLLGLLALSELDSERRFWVNDIYKTRDTISEFVLFDELMESSDDEEFRRYTRMDHHQFKFLLALIAPRIEKLDTNFRQAITTKQRLIITLRFLATGASQRHLSYSFRVGHTTVGKIIRETCEAISVCLTPIVMKPPSAHEWIAIAKQFEQLWNIPNCIGAIDGKHIRIKAPPNSGSEFFNYKGYFSIILLAICDANYKFILVDIGDSGRHSDGGVFINSNMGKLFEKHELNIPAPDLLPHSDITMPFYFVGDDAFPLKFGLMKPYPGKMLPETKRIFNYRLSRGRRVVENAFGILAVRWQIFYRMLNCEPKMVDVLVQSCVALHNYLQTPSQRCGDYFDTNGIIVDGAWRQSIPDDVNIRSIPSMGSNNYTRRASYIRDMLCTYFNTIGAVQWQWDH